MVRFFPGYFRAKEPTEPDDLEDEPMIVDSEPVTPTPTELDRLIAGESIICTFEGTSQYTQNGISACGLASFNALRVVFETEKRGVYGMDLLKAMMEREMIEKTVEICSSFPWTMHLEVDQIAKLPLFTRALRHNHTQYEEATKESFTLLLRRLIDSVPPEQSSAAVLTKAPEILAVFKIATQDPRLPRAYVVFDSHPRPETHPSGAAFCFYSKLDQAASHLAALLSVDDAILNDLGSNWQAQLLSHYSAHHFVSTERPALPSGSDVPIYEANVTILELSNNLEAIQSRLNELTTAHEEANKRNDQLASESTALRVELSQVRRQLTRLEQNQAHSLDRKGKQKAAEPSHRSVEDLSGKEKEGGFFARARDALSNGLFNPIPVDNTPSGGYTRSREWDESSVKHKESKPKPKDDYPQQKAPSSKTYDYSHNRPKGGYSDEKSYANAAKEETDIPKLIQLEYDMRNRQKERLNEWNSTKDATKKVQRTQWEDVDADADADLAWRLQREFDQENAQLISQRNDLSAQAVELFQCRICMEELPEDSVAVMDKCRHKFCRECMLGYIKSQLNDNKFPINCPVCIIGDAAGQQPTGGINRFIAETIGLSQQELEKFDVLQVGMYSVLIDCRACEQSLPVDKEDLRQARIITCPGPRCLHMWCKTCYQSVDSPSPDDHSCDGTKELDSLMKTQGWKKCPGCDTPSQKIHGCNHMTCITPNCNMHWCYKCGQAIISQANARLANNDVNAHYRHGCALFEYDNIQ